MPRAVAVLNARTRPSRGGLTAAQLDRIRLRAEDLVHRARFQATACAAIEAAVHGIEDARARRRAERDAILLHARTIRSGHTNPGSKNHLLGLFNALVGGVTNVGAVSLNAKAQWIKDNACGFRNRDHFLYAITAVISTSTRPAYVLPTRTPDHPE